MNKKRNIVILLLIIISTFFLTGCGITTTREVVNAKVINKEYVESYTDYGYYFDPMKLKYRFKFKTFPEEYNVTIQYENYTETYDSKELYENIEIGSIVEVDLVSSYDSNNELIDQYISRRY